MASAHCRGQWGTSPQGGWVGQGGGGCPTAEALLLRASKGGGGGGGDVCAPRQGVTHLYRPSICTCSVRMEGHRNLVRRGNGGKAGRPPV